MSVKSLDEPILLADDEEEVRKLLQTLLHDLGFKTVSCTGGLDGLKLAAEAKPFLIISDLRMKQIDGIEFCRRLRATGNSVPFVILTGYADKDVAMAGLKIGLTDLMEKPVKIADLEKIVSVYAKKRLAELLLEEEEQKRLLATFVEEARDLLDGVDELVLRLEAETIDVVTVDLLFRKVHTIKGSAASFSHLQPLSKLAHQFENSLSALKTAPRRLGPAVINHYLAIIDIMGQIIGVAGDLNLPENLKQEAYRLAEGIPSPDASQAKPAAGREAPPTHGAEVNQEADGVFVTNEKLDAMMKMSGDLVILKNAFQMLTRDSEWRDNPAKHERKLATFSRTLDRFSDQMQDHMMGIRKVSLQKALAKVPRLFRQTAGELQKKVTLQTEGFEISVDKNIAKALSLSMTHMIRNALDHGIESSSEERITKGKSEVGTVTIRAKDSSSVIQLTVADDGRGIDRNRVLKKAIEKGLISEAQGAKLTEEEVYDLLFLPGFSTAEGVSQVSGRGVGMDAVKAAIVHLHGRITIASSLGSGTTISIEIPVPKSVMVEQTVIAETSGVVLAVPLTGIAQIQPLTAVQATLVGTQLTMQHGPQTITVRELSDLTGKTYDPEETANSHSKRGKTVIVLRGKDKAIGLLVSQILGQFEAVIRPFDAAIGALPGFKGTASLDDDRIAYVVNPAEVVTLQFDKKEKAA